MPLAPPLFSTSTFWPSSVVRPCASRRAITSVAPPGGKPTTRRIDLSGKAGVWATAGRASDRRLPASSPMNFERNISILPVRTSCLVGSSLRLAFRKPRQPPAASIHGRCPPYCCGDAAALDLALQRAAEHHARLGLVEVAQRHVGAAAIVPHHHVAEAPAMAVDELRRGRMRIQHREQALALLVGHAEEAADALVDQQRLAAGLGMRADHAGG